MLRTVPLMHIVSPRVHRWPLPFSFRSVNDPVTPRMDARQTPYSGSMPPTLVTLLVAALAVVGGVLADYIGRRRTMIFAILAYSITTGLSAFAWDWVSFAIMRFVVGVAIGSEWSTGASITAEAWPDNARGRGAGLMQCGLGIGFFLASFAWLAVQIELARGAQPEAGTKLKKRRVSF